MVGIEDRAKSIFLDALEIASAPKRAAFIQDQCGDNADLRREVGALLDHANRLGGFMQSMAEGSQATLDRMLTEQTGTQIGPYKLLEQIGEGGMGIVYVAEQTEPVRRRVALKIIKPGMDTKQVIARFEAERQALAMMDHPNIAKVLDAGTTDAGRPYFVMELVRGLPVTEYCDKARLSPRQRLGLFIDVCHAVQHAHQKGIIHRDLKPSNVMITVHDGRPVAKVIDFGVAKAVGQQLTERTVYTAHTQLVGTPLYMSPEQADFSSQDVDTRSDVYSLGVLLYELLTGQTPFDQDTLHKAGFDEMRRIIREDEPPCPSRRFSTLSTQAISTVSQHRSVDERHLGRVLRGELDWIVMKALEKNRSRRYESASFLAADIQRYLSDEPVLACPPTAMYRFQKFARKHKAALFTATAIALCLLLGTTVSAWQAARATTAEAHANANEAQAKEAAAAEAQQRQRAEANEQKAVANAAAAQEKEQEAVKQRDEVKALNEKLAAKEQQLRRAFYAANMKLAKRALEEGDVLRALGLLDQHRPMPGEPDLRGFEWHYLFRLCHAGPSLTLKGHEYVVRSVAFSPDGKHLVSKQNGGSSSGYMTATTKFEPQIKLWDTKTGQELHTLKCGYCNVDYSPDGRRLASGAQDDSTVKVWDTQSGQELLVLKGHGTPVEMVVFSPEGKRLASGSKDKAVIWDAQTGQELLSFKSGGSQNSQSVAFSPDGKRLARGIAGRVQDGKRAPGEVKVHDAQTGQELLALTGGGYIVAFSQDGKRLASSSGSGWENGASVAEEIRVWDSQTGQELPSLGEKSDSLILFAFSPDSKRLAVASQRTTPRIKISDTETGQEVLTLFGHASAAGYADSIDSLAFSPDSQYLASSAKDLTTRIWDLQTGKDIQSQRTQRMTQRVISVAFSPDGQRLVTGAGDGSVKIWEVPSLARRRGPIAMSPDFSRATNGSTIWDVQTGKDIVTLSGDTKNVGHVTFSPDGKRLATSHGGGGRRGQELIPSGVKIWDAHTGREVLSLQGIPASVLSMLYSPDSKRLAIRFDREVKIWDAQTGAEIRSLQGSPAGGPFVRLAYSPDGKRLASGRWDGEIKVWDALTGQEIRSFEGDGPCVGFSPDGKRLASIASNGSATIWDVQSGSEVLTFKSGVSIGPPGDLKFSPDGSRLCHSKGENMTLWDTQTGQETLSLKSGGRSLVFSADGHQLAAGATIYDATPLPEKP